MLNLFIPILIQDDGATEGDYKEENYAENFRSQGSLM